MARFLAGRGFGFAIAAILLISLTVGYRRVLHVNQTTVALSFLLAILAVSAVWGMVVSVFMSISAMLVFNYYFLPPVGTFTICGSAKLGGFGRVFVDIDRGQPTVRANTKRSGCGE